MEEVKNNGVTKILSEGMVIFVLWLNYSVLWSREKNRALELCVRNGSLHPLLDHSAEQW